MSKSKVVFFITGSVAAFKAAAVVSKLVQSGCELQCVLSESAARFVGAATFEGLTGRPVLQDLWESGRAMDHIRLSRWADFGVVCPASANTLAKFSLGLADDVVSSTLLAWPKGKRLFVFPAMNSEMLSAKPTQSHIRALRDRGILVAENSRGTLACGEFGDGRLLEPEEILRILSEADSRSATQNAAPDATLRKKEPGTFGRILITAGATREPIDGIRFITNHSTGRTGAELAAELAGFGWSVTYLHGQGAVKADVNKALEFSSYKDLCEKLLAELGAYEYDAVIQCAAVSDYTVDEVSHSDSLGGLNPSQLVDKKIPSGQDLILHLCPTAKLLPQLREFSRNENIRVIGFKLTLNSSREELLKAASSILDPTVDAIVANDWAELQAARVAGQADRHPGVVLFRSSSASATFATVPELAQVLVDFLQPSAADDATVMNFSQSDSGPHMGHREGDL